jgi:hypothetical protein
LYWNIQRVPTPSTAVATHMSRSRGLAGGPPAQVETVTRATGVDAQERGHEDELVERVGVGRGER